MSKTYHKYVSFCDNGRGGSKSAKRQANKKVRRFEGDIPKGHAYIVKMYCSYDIHDYRWTYYSKQEIMDSLDNDFGERWLTGKTLSKIRRSKWLYHDKMFSRQSIRKMSTN